MATDKADRDAKAHQLTPTQRYTQSRTPLRPGTRAHNSLMCRSDTLRAAHPSDQGLEPTTVSCVAAIHSEPHTPPTRD
ncbi:hypothetical protein J6590_082396 [Homalodisca vitripennis]|nr:hypothetical protein J6590_082396 [Homalodisca vitripennis]